MCDENSCKILIKKKISRATDVNRIGEGKVNLFISFSLFLTLYETQRSSNFES